MARRKQSMNAQKLQEESDDTDEDDLKSNANRASGTDGPENSDKQYQPGINGL